MLSVDEIKSSPYFISIYNSIWFIVVFLFSSLIAHICERNNQITPTGFKLILVEKNALFFFFLNMVFNALQRKKKKCRQEENSEVTREFLFPLWQLHFHYFFKEVYFDLQSWK